MYDKKINLLFDEAERLLQLSIELQKEMLSEQGLSEYILSDEYAFNKRKTEERVAELESELHKTHAREMVLAVVGPMKAGKSTTINAIVGKEILPNRNGPMTSLPTLIRHVSGKTEPTLYLKHIQPIRQLLIALKENRAIHEGHQTGDIRELLERLEDDTWLKNEYCGEDEIRTGLSSLNDLVRLATAMDVEFPFDEYADFQKLPVIDVEFSHLMGMNACKGTLTLLDTPGPNEAGQPQMEVMMRDQLQKASAVLAVMDYTQMNSRADEDVRKELNAIADVSVERLFVLVNKFDEKDRNGDSADTVRQKVSTMLYGGVLPAHRVYPGSSRQAYLANRALHELRKGEMLPADDAWVDDFIREVFGPMAEEDDWKNSAEVNKRAQKLWEISLFNKIITEVIQSSHSNALKMIIGSSASKLMENAHDVHESISLRNECLNKDILMLKEQITNLHEDIDVVSDYKNKIKQDVQNVIFEINDESQRVFNSVVTTLSDRLYEYFSTGKFKEQKGCSEYEQVKDFEPSGFVSDHPDIKFKNRQDAIKQIDTIKKSVEDLISDANEVLHSELDDMVKGFEARFCNEVSEVVDEIALRINKQLADIGFTVNITFPSVRKLNNGPSVKTNWSGSLLEDKKVKLGHMRRASGMWGEICRWFNTSDWGWVHYNLEVEIPTINISNVINNVKNYADEYFSNVRDSIKEDLVQSLECEMYNFLSEFQSKVEELQHTLLQSLADRKHNQQEREHLTERLKELNDTFIKIINDSKGLRDELETLK